MIYDAKTGEFKWDWQACYNDGKPPEIETYTTCRDPETVEKWREEDRSFNRLLALTFAEWKLTNMGRLCGWPHPCQENWWLSSRCVPGP